MSTLAAELVRDTASLAALRNEWAALWVRAKTATPFQHPAWLLPWWQIFGTAALRVAVLHGPGGRLLGLLPLYELPGERKILPLGAGLSDYHDALLDVSAPPDAASALLRTALQDCDLPCHLPDLPPDAALRAAAAPAGWQALRHVVEPCPVLRPEDVPALQRRKLRMSRHRADRIGGFALEVATSATASSMFESLLGFHAARWRERGVLSDPNVLAFHRAAIPALASAGLLCMQALRFGARVVAVIYALRAFGRVYLYLSGFDADHAFESPGTILLGAMLDEPGVEEFHFLRGTERYKYAWGAVDRLNELRVLVPP